ncbi:carboxypeptidase regulatory-like domain-containing protein [Hymenobacter humi]|uniref:Carboxypeptidase regulatory-like domain-containing protein n=1 Tax=Hymenobacter humi TaxID=1411620 RepID=A0ABW2UC03_9BACT
MRASLLLAASLLTYALGLKTAKAQNNKTFASSSAFVPAATRGGSDAPRAARTAPAATKLFTGHVVSPAGILPGAVVEVVGTDLSAVTNAAGEFSLALPATTGPVQLLVSYGGFADERITLSPTDKSATLKLATPQPIKVARRQRMKAYSKTAQRQIKRTLRKL